MDNPFPGMNPYLEQPELWHQVHNRLIIAIADALTPQVAPHYLVAIEERVYQSVEESLLVGIADVALTRRTADPQRLGSTATTNRIAPVSVRVPIPLRPDDAEPSVDLQRLLNEIYRRARFDLMINYAQPLKPALVEDDAIWVREILRMGGLDND